MIYILGIPSIPLIQ